MAVKKRYGRGGKTMGENDVTSIRRLMEELERLEERFAGEPVAIEVLEAVKFWAIEESV